MASPKSPEDALSACEQKKNVKKADCESRKFLSSRKHSGKRCKAELEKKVLELFLLCFGMYRTFRYKPNERVLKVKMETFYPMTYWKILFNLFVSLCKLLAPTTLCVSAMS